MICSGGAGQCWTGAGKSHIFNHRCCCVLINIRSSSAVNFVWPKSLALLLVEQQMKVSLPGRKLEATMVTQICPVVATDKHQGLQRASKASLDIRAR